MCIELEEYKVVFVIIYVGWLLINKINRIYYIIKFEDVIYIGWENLVYFSIF